MSCRFWSYAAALSAAVVLNTIPAARAIDDAPPSGPVAENPPEESPAEAEPKPADDKQKAKPITDAKGIEAALLKKVSVTELGTPLKQFADNIEAHYGISVEIDVRCFADAGLDPEAIEINFDERNLSLGAVLHHTLRPHGLSFVLSNDVLLITTRERTESITETRVYPAIDLLAFRQADGSVRDDANPLMKLVQEMCSPESWQTAGGEGTINTHDGLFSVKQTRRVHEQIAALLETLRSAKKAAAEGNLSNARTAGDNAEVEAALAKATIEPDYIQLPLREVADKIQASVKYSVIVDDLELTNAGIDPESVELNASYRRGPVKSALARMLSQHALAGIVDHGVVVITTEERSRATLETAAYPIGDLLPDELKMGEAQIQRGRALQCLVADAVDSAMWDDEGGSSHIEFAAPWNLLVVSAPAETQEKIRDTLAKLREAKQQQAESGLAPSDAATTDDLVLLRVFKLGSVTGGNQEAADKIAELVRELVPETRANEPDNPEGPYLRTVGDRMVVMNRRSVLVKVESLLDQFDSASGGKFSKTTASAGEPASTK
jgi:hypothetical protein